MRKVPRHEVKRGLQGRDPLGRRLSRRTLLALPFPRGAAAAMGEAVPGHQSSRPVRCGACGGYHGIAAERAAGDPAGIGGDGGAAGCPVEAHQRALARGFRIGHKAESPRSQSETKEEERGS